MERSDILFLIGITLFVAACGLAYYLLGGSFF